MSAGEFAYVVGCVVLALAMMLVVGVAKWREAGRGHQCSGR